MSDAVLIYGFGGPESSTEVMPFLRRVTAGRNVPDERLARVAQQYEAVGGASPYNRLTRQLRDDVESELGQAIYLAYRNCAPFLADVMQEMVAAGVREVTVFVPSAYSSESSCLRYRIELARAGEGLAISAWKLPPFFAESGFIDPIVDGARAARLVLGEDARLVCTAHSIPLDMGGVSLYVEQLTYVAERVAQQAGYESVDLVFQSRSGAPSDPWLGPDICEHLKDLATKGIRNVAIAPIGFTHDHMEVIYDLDTVALQQAAECEITALRVTTPGTDPRFLRMVLDLIQRGRQPGLLCDANCCVAQERV